MYWSAKAWASIDDERYTRQVQDIVVSVQRVHVEVASCQMVQEKVSLKQRVSDAVDSVTRRYD